MRSGLCIFGRGHVLWREGGPGSAWDLGEVRPLFFCIGGRGRISPEGGKACGARVSKVLQEVSNVLPGVSSVLQGEWKKEIRRRGCATLAPDLKYGLMIF